MPIQVLPTCKKPVKVNINIKMEENKMAVPPNKVYAARANLSAYIHRKITWKQAYAIAVAK